MVTGETDIRDVRVTLRHSAKNINRYKHKVTNESAKRLQKIIQREIDLQGLVKTGKLRSINRGGIHKRKIANGSYQVYMKADYAGYLEYGTRRGIKPYLYFTKAVRSCQYSYTDILKEINDRHKYLTRWLL